MKNLTQLSLYFPIIQNGKVSRNGKIQNGKISRKGKIQNGKISRNGSWNSNRVGKLIFLAALNVSTAS